MQPASWGDLHAMGLGVAQKSERLQWSPMIHLAGDGAQSLVQGAAQSDVQLLKAPANSEYWNGLLNRGTNQRQGHAIAFGIFLRLGVMWLRAVVSGSNIRITAGQDNAIEQTQQPLDIAARPVGRYQQRKSANNIGDGLHICIRRRMGQRLRRLELLSAARDPDESCHLLLM